MDGKVLLLEYSAYERQKIRQILSTAGRFEVIDVGDVSQFRLLDLDIKDLRLIIMDLMFPTEIDGLGVLSKISSSQSKSVPVIVISNSDSLGLREEVLKYSARDYIVRPYNVKRLEASIRSIVRTDTVFYYDTAHISDINMSFDSYMEREIMFAQRTSSPLSLVLITTLQMDRGPEIGQSVSEDMRKSVFSIAAAKSREALRLTDTIVMNGNRDIIIVLPGTDEIGARLVCEKIVKLLDPEFKRLSIDISQRVYPVYVTFPDDGNSLQQLMATAFKKVSDKEMLEKITSIPTDARKYADKSYNRYKRWL
ncbi:MAG: response regulator [Clostridiaceae bacterium]|nr:response regulator [Clostridiaceae bacterium]